VVKLDSSGNVVWTKTIGGSSNDFAYSIIQSSDGGYVVAGSTGSFGAGSYDIYVVKLNSYGSAQWTKTIGGSLSDEARSIIQSSDGGFVVAGNTRSFGAGVSDIYVVKLDNGGNVLWTKTIGGSSNDGARSIIQSSDGGFVVAGWTNSFGAGGYDMYIVKIDGSGNVAWTKTIGGSGNDYAYSIIQDLDGNYVVVGWGNSFGAGNNDIYVVKLDSSGNVVWTKTIGGSGDDGANSIIQSSDGAYVIAGHTNSFSSSYDFYVVKIDSSGNVLWTKTIGGNLYDQAHSIIQSSDGGYIVVGITQSFGAGGYDVYVAKIDSSGNVLWTKTIGGGSADVAMSITRSSDGGFAIAGYTQSFGAGLYDIYVMKTGPLVDICWSQGITNYVVSSGGTSSPQSPNVSLQSPTVNSVSPVSGSWGSVSSVCFSAGAPPVPMCLISGGCDYYQASSDMEKVMETMKGVEKEKEQIKSYGCSVGGVYKYFILPVILLLYSWFRFRIKKKAKSSCFRLF
jgi:arginine repressor